MAKNKNNPDDTINALQDALFSSNYGMSKKFVDNNQTEIYKSNKAVSDVLNGYGLGNGSAGFNSLHELSRLVGNSVRFKRNQTVQDVQPDFQDDSLLDSGIRSITPMGNMDQDEQDVIGQSIQMYSSFLTCCSEYRGVVNIIPEVKKAIENIARDIMNVSELSGKCFNKVYGKNIDKVDASSLEVIARCSELLKTEIIEKNNLEEKYERWLFESITTGVKPVAFIPYDHIIEELKQLNSKENFSIDVGKVSKRLHSRSRESSVLTDDETKSFESSIIEHSLKDVIRSSPNFKRGVESVDISIENTYDAILDDGLVSTYMEMCEETFNQSYLSFKSEEHKVHNDQNKAALLGRESVYSKEQIDIMESLNNSFDKQISDNKALSVDDRKQKAKDGLKKLIDMVDGTIDVVKPNYSSAYVVNKICNEKDRYSKFYDLGKDYKLPEALKTLGYKETKGSKVENYDTKSELGKECLIVPYSPESVIPINVNGEYMGFYVLEYDNLMGPSHSKRRRPGSFTDYVQQQGIGNDGNLLSGGSMPSGAYGGADPLENDLYSPSALYNYSASQYMNGGGADMMQGKRYDVLKSVVMKVISHRLRDPDLVDNKVFKDAVMHMLRNDIIARKTVQFTFIPPEFMCYMTYKTDDDGMPVSILDGTLFFCYLYISSIVSSGMIKLLKSADKEKYEIDVGLQKNMGYTATELQRQLSTRSIYTQSMFSSLSSVIRYAGNYQRMIIPVIKDKKLYDVTQIERTNNLDPDDAYTDKLLVSILSKIFVNSGVISDVDQVDFAKQISMKNLEYKASIVRGQRNYKPFVDKILKTLTYYSPIASINSKIETGTNAQGDLENKIDISMISYEPAPPTFLSMTNIIEVVNTAKEVANTLAEVFNLNDNNTVNAAANAKFKRKIIEKYATIIEFDELNDLVEKCISDSKRIVVEDNKNASIDEKINTPSDEDSDLQEQPIGGDGGIGGSNMGSDFSSDTGDDSGGGMDDFDL